VGFKTPIDILGNDFFSENEEITSILLKGVKRIGSRAFMSCPNL
jgi:hypothetical protein